MGILQILAFAGAMFILAATPGPGVFATVARAMASGFPHAAILAVGIICGDLLFLLFALYGLASVAEILGSFFVIVKYLGSLYLIWLGIQILRSKPEQRTVQGVKELSWKKNFISGLVITLGNPKVILFYLSFLPTFIDLKSIAGIDVLIISLTVVLVLGLVLLGYSLAAARARTFFTDPSSQKWCNRCAGGVMMTTGAILLSKN